MYNLKRMLCYSISAKQFYHNRKLRFNSQVSTSGLSEWPGSKQHAQQFYFWIHLSGNIAVDIQKIHILSLYTFLVLSMFTQFYSFLKCPSAIATDCTFIHHYTTLHRHFIVNFDVLLTVRLSIFISVINQLDAQNFCFTISLFHASTCFEHHVLITKRSKLYLYSLTYRCDDTRGCINTILTSWWWAHGARNM